tara:strand:- start:850 stop:1170 length:321 start_codon:yes stop_codon:yes gene_type:complete
MRIKRVRNSRVKIKIFAGNKTEFEDVKSYAEVELKDDITLVVIKSKVCHEKLDKDVLRYILSCPITGMSVNRYGINGKTQKELLSKISQYPDLAEKVAKGRLKSLT